jgi:prophage regulatory protein
MKILRLPEVLGIIGISRSKLYADIKAGQMPPPISLGARAVGWLDQDINDWIERRIQVARTGIKSTPQCAAPA